MPIAPWTFFLRNFHRYIYLSYELYFKKRNFSILQTHVAQQVRGIIRHSNPVNNLFKYKNLVEAFTIIVFKKTVTFFPGTRYERIKITQTWF